MVWSFLCKNQQKLPPYVTTIRNEDNRERKINCCIYFNKRFFLEKTFHIILHFFYSLLLILGCESVFAVACHKFHSKVYLTIRVQFWTKQGFLSRATGSLYTVRRQRNNWFYISIYCLIFKPADPGPDVLQFDPAVDHPEVKDSCGQQWRPQESYTVWTCYITSNIH